MNVDYTNLISVLKTIFKNKAVYGTIKNRVGALIKTMLKELEKNKPELFKIVLTKLYEAEQKINDSGDLSIVLKEIEDVNFGAARCGVYMIINYTDLFVKIIQNSVNVDKLVKILKILPIGKQLEIIASCFGFEGSKSDIMGWLANQCKDYLNTGIEHVFNELRQMVVDELVLTNEQRNDILLGGLNDKISIEQIDKNKIAKILEENPKFEVPILLMRGVFHVLLKQFENKTYTKMYNEKFGVKQQGGYIDLLGFIMMIGLVLALIGVIIKIIKQNERRQLCYNNDNNNL